MTFKVFTTAVLLAITHDLRTHHAHAYQRRPTLPPCARLSETYTPYCAHSYLTPTLPTVHTPIRHLHSLLCIPHSDTYRPYCVHPTQIPTGPTVYIPLRYLQALLCHPIRHLHSLLGHPIRHLHSLLCTLLSDPYTPCCVHPNQTSTGPTVYTPSDTYTPYCVHPYQTSTRHTVYTPIRHLHSLLCTLLSHTYRPYCVHLIRHLHSLLCTLYRNTPHSHPSSLVVLECPEVFTSPTVG